MILAIKQKNDNKINGNAFNFGPNNKSSLSVIGLVKEFKKKWPILNWQIVKSKKKFLNQACSSSIVTKH